MFDNRLKIECHNEKIAYYHYNEGNNQWDYIKNPESDLSRKEFTDINIVENAEKIAGYIDSKYNYGDGVEILFVGNQNEYNLFNDVIQKMFPEIVCRRQETSGTEIILIGGPDSGAEELLEAIIGTNERSDYEKDGISITLDLTDDVKYYLLNSDLFDEQIFLQILSYQEIKTVLYCISSLEYNEQILCTSVNSGVKTVVIQTNPSEDNRKKQEENINGSYESAEVIAFPKISLENEEDNKENQNPVIRALCLDKVARHIYGHSLNVVIMGRFCNDIRKITQIFLNETIELDLPDYGQTQVYCKSLLLPKPKDYFEMSENELSRQRTTIFESADLGESDYDTLDVLDKIQCFYSQERKFTADTNLIILCDRDYGYGIGDYTKIILHEIYEKYDIPVVLIILSESGYDYKYEEWVEENFPGTRVFRIIAKECLGEMEISYDQIKAAINLSIRQYEDIFSSFILEKQNKRLQEIAEQSRNLSVETQNKIDACEKCVKNYVNKAKKKGLVPVANIPMIHGLCEDMIKELNEISEIEVDEKHSLAFLLNIFETTLMIVPVVGSLFAGSYVSAVGTNYTKAIERVLEKSTREELSNYDVMQKRIEEALTEISQNQ